MISMILVNLYKSIFIYEFKIENSDFYGFPYFNEKINNATIRIGYSEFFFACIFEMRINLYKLKNKLKQKKLHYKL